MTDYKPRALFAISSLGLGHATRSLVVLREYLHRGYSITVISSGNALTFLRLELAEEKQVEFREMIDYPALERGMGWRLYWYLLIDLFKTWQLIRQEHHELQRFAADYDFIFSDGRYGFYSRWTPSFILTHQIAFIPPRGLREASWLTENVNIAALRRFDAVLIPDYPCPSINLAGHLAHSKNLHRCHHRYVGLLSSYRHLPVPQDIDYLFIISGYLLEHKDSFIHNLLTQAIDLPGQKVFVLGATSDDSNDYAAYRRKDLEIHTVASGMLRQELFNRAHCIISRAGYTTVMDLVEHNKRALLIPTPNQTEQEYLAYYLGSHEYFITRSQQADLDLAAALYACEKTRQFTPPWYTDESIQRISENIEEMLHKHFFSIIVPAHDEELELSATLESLLAQRYPEDLIEILVIENGSTDNTYEIARSFTNDPAYADRIRLLRCEQGVSRARNTGLENVSRKSEWVIFCDADTRLGPRFVWQLNTWLNRHGGGGLSIGTTSVGPHTKDRLYARSWFATFDMIHRVTKSSFAIQLARTPIARGIRFREDLNYSEDLVFIHECRRYGRFFFVPTDQVTTSTRRFEKKGYLRQGLSWLFEALLPLRFKLHRKYDVIR